MQYLYLIKCQQFYKIGITKDIGHRMRKIKTDNPYPVELVSHCEIDAELDQVVAIEKGIHSLLRGARKTGEWFELKDGEAKLISRTFSHIQDKDINAIKSLTTEWQSMIGRVNGRPVTE